jgi:hypothetical protein
MAEKPDGAEMEDENSQAEKVHESEGAIRPREHLKVGLDLKNVDINCQEAECQNGESALNPMKTQGDGRTRNIFG